MKCEACGTDNPQGMSYCGNCGRPLDAAVIVSQDSRTRNCVACGRSIGWDAAVCMYCGHDYRTGTKKGTEGHLLVGAILTLLAGILGVALTVISRFDGHIDSIISSPTGVLYLACAILGVVGGYAALRRKWFPIAVLGAGAAIITPAFLFAIPGLILIASSATRFKDHSDKT